MHFLCYDTILPQISAPLTHVILSGIVPLFIVLKCIWVYVLCTVCHSYRTYLVTIPHERSAWLSRRKFLLWNGAQWDQIQTYYSSVTEMIIERKCKAPSARDAKNKSWKFAQIRGGKAAGRLLSQINYSWWCSQCGHTTQNLDMHEWLWWTNTPTVVTDSFQESVLCWIMLLAYLLQLPVQSLLD